MLRARVRREQLVMKGQYYLKGKGCLSIGFWYLRFEDKMWNRGSMPIASADTAGQHLKSVVAELHNAPPDLSSDQISSRGHL
jgi:hypothetical protein